MSTAQQRLHREDTLFQLLNRLPGEDFGQQPACASDEVDPELFFPVSDQAQQQIAAAKRVCASCPVRQACLQFALHSDVEGLWGATTQQERKRLRREDSVAVAA
ncbi:hypothetical protein FHX42_004473 [Saccharopolyspora lacisalsi]|uniref:4Fe-4S Wbl-type domain-containing protein n=1 Tax=Halosaccharopolyspora lacisalsi TaxID=1000566 RepID=A0A839E2I5_9PSEU|nr:WhiB family transcriptional regulator [Halosaccharopolyspora lacisalsi]MBA8827089.1 hypothetical protein [Halosaccharopolyspora lacisalsi]